MRRCDLDSANQALGVWSITRPSALNFRGVGWAEFVLAVLLAVSMSDPVPAAEASPWVQKPTPSYDDASKSWRVSFELATASDIEVAIVDRRMGRIVRHLAAGVLGEKAPPPLTPNSLRQSINWDGRDDEGRPVPNPDQLAVRVRTGMSVALERIVGGDPYAFYSEEMGDSDHSPWGIFGLEAKPDGRVYVLGHSSNLGTAALRQYDVDGNYLRTLFPPPAGKTVEDMQGWGLHVRPGGTYVPIFNKVSDPSLSTTFLDAGHLQVARMFPTPDAERLTFWSTSSSHGLFQRMEIRTDGTIAADANERLPGPLVTKPPFPSGSITPGSHIIHAMRGPVFSAFAPNGKSFYLSGLFAAQTRYGSVLEIDTEGFWRDGQVWKVDRETGIAKVFFSLDAKSIPTDRRARVAAYGGTQSYSAVHGVAVDQKGRVYVCDRLNDRVLVLDEQGKIVREIPVDHPDAIATSDRTGALYVTTRVGDYHRRGVVKLLKFAEWPKDTTPAFAIEVSKTGYTNRHVSSHVVACDTDEGTNVWVAHTQMPVRIYRDRGNGEPELLKDFYRVDGAQRCLGFDRMQVDPVTDHVYVLDAHDAVWRISDWNKPRFEKLPIQTASIAIDVRRRYLYARTLRDGSSSNSVGRIARYHLDRENLPPANVAKTGTNRVTPEFHYEWCFEGNSDKGLAVAPNGDIAVVGDAKDGLRVFARSETTSPWKATTIAKLARNAGGVRFDLRGNLYVGVVDSEAKAKLPGFEGDRFLSAMGRIHVFAPTGQLESGPLFPTPPQGPSRILDVPFGAFETDCVTRSPRFGVDGFGRIYYPTNIASRVSIIDNAGNEILHFGAYGNRDSAGGLPGELVPTTDVPLAFPNSVDATEDYVYVADMINLRVLRLRKKFAEEVSVDLR